MALSSMDLKRIHADSYTPKYASGKWSFDEKTNKLVFEQHNDLEKMRERYVTTNGFKFLRTVDQVEEMTFRQEFMRPKTTYDADTVVINDVRDLVLYLMPSELLTDIFLDFIHKPAVHRLLHALIIYFEYFLRTVEFILIRRDELSGKMGQVQSEQTNDMKRRLSTYLSQYRMLVARNYSVIVKGEGDMGKFYHMKEADNISDMIKDRRFHEEFLAVAIQIVWISMRRRAYNVIEMEMCRLFCSEHFIIHREEYLSFTPAERNMLYGRKNKIVYAHNQLSPLIQELQNIADEDLPILWIGDRKYRGTNIHILEIELEYIVPGPQLRMIDVAHGLLGNPKALYNTILELDWPSVRDAHFTEYHDPYHIIRQPHLSVPLINEEKVLKMSKHYDHFYRVYRIYEPVSKEMINKWKRRDRVIQHYRREGGLIDIWRRCEDEVALDKHSESVDDLASKYSKQMHMMRRSQDTDLFNPVKISSSVITLAKVKTHKRRRSFITGDDHYFVPVSK